MTEPTGRNAQVPIVWIVVLLVLAGIALWVNYGPGAKPSVAELPPLPKPAIDSLDESLRQNIERGLTAARESPLDPGINKALGMLFHANALLAEAQVCYRRAAQLAPDDFETAYLLAQSSLQGSNHQETLEFCDRAAEIKADYVPLIVLRGQVHWQYDDLPAAERVFVDMIGQYPTVPAGHYWLGRVYARLGRTNDAIKRFRRAITLSPANRDVLYALGMALRDAGEPEEAARHLRAYERADSRRMYNDPIAEQLMLYRTGPEAVFQQGQRLAEAGRYDEAIAVYQEAIRLDPKLAEAHQNLGVTYMRLGRLDDAIASLNQALEVNPSLPQARTNLATSLARAGRMGEAENAFQSAVELDPNNPAVYNDYANALAATGRFEDAVKFYQDAIRVAPGDLPPRVNLGIALHNMNKTEEAIATYQEALRQFEGEQQLMELLARALISADRTSEAVALLEGAIEGGADHPAMHHALANAYAAAGRYSDAELKYQQVLLQAPGVMQVVADFYAMLETQKAYDKALNLLRQVRAAQPQDAAVADRLAWLLATCPVEELRNGQEAMGLAEALCTGTRFEFAEPMLTLAVAYAEIGRFEKARETIERAIAVANKANDQELLSRLKSVQEQLSKDKPYRLPL